MTTIRVLVVDDSAFARKVLREVLADAPGIEVVGSARDGLEALEKIAELKPDVVTLDLVMPHLDGVELLRALPSKNAPRVIIVSISGASSELGVRALQAGAVELIRKPTALATDQLYDLREELVRKVRIAAEARQHAPVEPAKPVLDAAVPLATSRSILVVGTSTGGPQALTRLLTMLPAGFPLPIAIALHIPAGYTDALARRLNESCAIDVQEAYDGLALRKGLAIIAPGGSHLSFRREPHGVVAQIGARHDALLYAPSVDVLFKSAVEHHGASVLGVVLTGMGSDGLAGARVIHEAGGVLLTESESSCVVYGMPRCVVEAGYGNGAAPIDEMARQILNHL